MDSISLLRQEQGRGDDSISKLAADILAECVFMENEGQTKGIAAPSLAADVSTAFWSEALSGHAAARTKTLGLLNRLTVLLQGPHDFLHEFVAPNWDHGALYTFLQSQTLDHIASSGGRASLPSLSNQSGIPEDKLARILALLRCRNFVHEPENGIFTLTAVSEELINDKDFRAWVEFQLYETRIASVHLAEALAGKPNDYNEGVSGFKQGWGVEMYDWHASHPEKGDRFRRAMKGVSKCKLTVKPLKSAKTIIIVHMLTSTALDPADFLIRAWFQRDTPSSHRKVVEIGGRYGFASVSLVREQPEFLFEVRCDSEDFLRRGEASVGQEFQSRIAFTHITSLFDLPTPSDSSNVFVYVIRNVFWNWTDANIIKLLQGLLPILRASSSLSILVTDGVSPLPNEFPPHVEIGYRRRDVTTMTMHNVKQRTQVEWLFLFAQVDPALKVTTTFENSSHVYKGLWELSLKM